MRASHRMLAVLTTTLVICSHTLSAQNSPVTLSLSRPDWMSAESFSFLSSVRVLSNGMVLVVDGQELEVQLLDARGKTVKQIGRKGAGPSEYTFPLRLIGLPNDTSLLIDRDARRYLVIDPRGLITKTEPFPTALGAFAELMVGADASGRLLFGRKAFIELDRNSPTEPISRWARGSDSFETVTMFRAENPKSHPIDLKNPGYKEFAFKSLEVFSAVDDWVTGRSGRVAIIHASPYRVDWAEPDGKIKIGTAIPVKPIAVTELDRKEHEPKGPPYKRYYAKLKSPFLADAAIVDDKDNVWVPRSENAEFKNRRWDVISATGKLRGTVLVPRGRMLIAVTAKYAYIRYVDTDGLHWLERYSR